MFKNRKIIQIQFHNILYEYHFDIYIYYVSEKKRNDPKPQTLNTPIHSDLDLYSRRHTARIYFAAHYKNEKRRVCPPR